MRFNEWFATSSEFNTPWPEGGRLDYIVTLQEQGWVKIHPEFDVVQAIYKVVANPLRFLGRVQSLASFITTGVDLCLKGEYLQAASSLLDGNRAQDHLIELVDFLRPSNLITLPVGLESNLYNFWVSEASNRDIFFHWFAEFLLDSTTLDLSVQAAYCLYNGYVWEYKQLAKLSSYTQVPRTKAKTILVLSCGLYLVTDQGPAGDNSLRIYFKDKGKILDQLDFTNLIWLQDTHAEHTGRPGVINTNIKLNQFSTTVRAFTQQITDSSAAKTAVLIYGAPGTGKSSWAFALAAEYYSPRGYLTFLVQAEDLKHFTLPTIINKAVVIVNDIDAIADDRSKSLYNSSFGTERLLSLLDGTMTNLITLDHSEPDKHIVWLFTANSRDRMDEAFLRKGRIDYQHEFTEVYV